MDTGRLITRQLRYARAGAETKEQVEQVEWWLARVTELREQQPRADAPAEAPAPELAATGTEGRQ